MKTSTNIHHRTDGKQLRLSRLFHSDNRVFFVPMDHSLTNGPIGNANRTDELIRIIGNNGGDGVVLHKGRVRVVNPELFSNVNLIVHLSASTEYGVSEHAKVLVANVEEALALGADAVSTHVNIGSATEGTQLADMGAIARECERWGIPLLAMMYARGDEIEDPLSPKTLSHLASIAVDLGADIVKMSFSGSINSMEEVVATCPIPVVVAGGQPLESEDEVVAFARDVMMTGASGLAMGRSVFQSPDPARLVWRLAQVVHGASDVVTPIESADWSQKNGFPLGLVDQPNELPAVLSGAER